MLEFIFLRRTSTPGGPRTQWLSIFIYKLHNMCININIHNCTNTCTYSHLRSVFHSKHLNEQAYMQTSEHACLRTCVHVCVRARMQTCVHACTNERANERTGKRSSVPIHLPACEQEASECTCVQARKRASGRTSVRTFLQANKQMCVRAYVRASKRTCVPACMRA